MKRYSFLAAFGCVVLAFAAVWLGGLNQDEGWYLYAANMVADGKILYRDFFYTQAPVMPIVYSGFTWIWHKWGLLGARVFTVLLGMAGIALMACAAGRLVPADRKRQASLMTFLLLGCNLYHLYYLAIPKTYSLAALFIGCGFYLLTYALADGGSRYAGTVRITSAISSGLAFAFAAGTRISLGAMLLAVGVGLLIGFKRYRWTFLYFGIGGAVGLALVYGVFLLQPETRDGLVAAQAYHAARGGFDPVFTVGSLSRLVRWYLPVFIVLGLGIGSHFVNGKGERSPSCGFCAWLMLAGFLAVFCVQMLAPFPYEDYQVPLMGALTVFATVFFVGNGAKSANLLLVLGLAFATSFGSPLLEEWMTNGQDRFWTLKKEKCELAQLRDVARAIEEEDPFGKTLFTQDLYLAIETGRTVPPGLEMGPFSMLTDEEWRELITTSEYPVAALSGYSFAIDPPRCDEVPVERQMAYFSLLKERYDLAFKEDDFGQNATPLLVLRRKRPGPVENK